KVMVKDTIDIQGLKTIAGSRALLNVEPAQDDAEVVKNILKADCEIIAKTNLHELAFGITGINHAFGTPVNPKYPELIPGGSSSG
ncbi:amidase family protein, partial [Acinetobacter pittii]